MSSLARADAVFLPETAAAPAPVAVPEASRVQSIDLLRGTVMIIMALDHVRAFFHAGALVYSPTDLERTSVVLFFTRWITHFCAPVFVFLAGVSACIYGERKGREALSHFLWTRGLWLVFVEIVVLSLFKTFNPAFSYVNLQVIWAIGLCMLILSALVRLQSRWILLLGLALMAGHNLLDGVHVAGDGASAFLWSVLHEARRFRFGSFLINVQYPLLPWVGTMAVGYWFGGLYSAERRPAQRRRWLLIAGLSASLLFLDVRFANGYGEAAPWSARSSVAFSILSFLNLTKYPPSLLYLLMTLGPALVFLALTERAPRVLTAPIAIFGRVAMFYYLAHILLIHVAATLAAPLGGYRMADMVLSTPLVDAPALKGYGYGLPTVYFVWIALVLVLFPCCRWFDRYKRAHQSKHWWLSYL